MPKPPAQTKGPTMKIISTRSILPVAALCGAVGAASHAQAAGFYLQEQSIKGAGRAFSGEAADQGADSLWWNPAAIAGMPRNQLSLGASLIAPRAKVEDRGSLIIRPGMAPAPVGGDASQKNPIPLSVVPTGAVAMPLDDRWAVGLALTSAYSFSTDYNADSWTRYTADTSRLRSIDFQPSIAFAATGWLRLGAGLNIVYSEATLTNALPNLSPLLPDGSQGLSGDGWDLGWSAGLQLHDADRITLGLSYKSKVEHKLKGRVATAGLIGPLEASNGTINATASFSTPWQAIAGVRFKANDCLTLNAQLVRFGWSEFDAIDLGAPISQSLPQGYRDTWSVAVGADYELNSAWTLRGGVQYDQTPTVNGSRDARVPDSSRWNVATGLSYKATENLTIDAAAMLILFESASIDRPHAAYAGTPAQTVILPSGRVRNAHAIVVGLGGRFEF